MHFRMLGRTGLRISEVAFGGGYVGGILIHSDDETKREAFRRALAGGVNWVDTAPRYGDGRSEEALGWLLNEADSVPHISTKVRLDPHRLDDIAGQIEDSLTASLTRLERPGVDLLLLHNRVAVETSERALAIEHVLGKGGAADGLERMRAQGLTRYIGFTALGDGACCRRVAESDRFDAAQVYYNMLNPSAGRPMPAGWSGQDFGGLMEACHAQGVGVMAIRVFAAGVIATDQRTGRESPSAEDADIETEERRTRAVFDAIGLGHGTRAQTALRFALADPHVSCAIAGLSEVSHIDEALAAVDMGPLPQPVMAQLNDLYADNFGFPSRAGPPAVP